MRGTKLIAWRVPTVCKELQSDNGAAMVASPAHSRVLARQKQLLTATRNTLLMIAADVRGGLLETVGVESAFAESEKCSMILKLPADTDTAAIALAIDAENVEAWCDAKGRVHIGINPWYSTKDVDQTVLGAIKVIHVLLGLHASAENIVESQTLFQKLLRALKDVMLIQKSIKQRKD